MTPGGRAAYTPPPAPLEPPDAITDAEALQHVKDRFNLQAWGMDADSVVNDLNEIQSPKAVDGDEAVGSDDVNTYFEKRGRMFDNLDARRYYASLWDHLLYDERRDLDLLPFRFENFDDTDPNHAAIDLAWLIRNRDAVSKRFLKAMETGRDE